MCQSLRVVAVVGWKGARDRCIVTQRIEVLVTIDVARTDLALTAWLRAGRRAVRRVGIHTLDRRSRGAHIIDARRHAIARQPVLAVLVLGARLRRVASR